MTELLTAARMRAIEQAAINSGEVTGLELMERAGRGVVEAILEWRPAFAKTPYRAVVLCGPGNNGGDGFVVTRLLRQRGWDVEVFLFGDSENLPQDAAVNARRCQEMGSIRDPAGFEDAVQGTDLYVDALFGTGLGRPLTGETARLVNAATRARIPASVAIDAPSGVCLDSGRLLIDPADPGPAADLTVAFHGPKIGHFLAEGPHRCGRLAIVDIGLGSWNATQPAGLPADGSDTVSRGRASLPVLIDGASDNASRQTGGIGRTAKRPGHKYDHGHAIVLSGGPGKGGAARLAARGALRIGAGLVTIGCPPAALQENAARLDAVMLAPVKGVDGLNAEIRTRKVKAVCIGPGFGGGTRLREFVAAMLKEAARRAGGEPETARDARPALVLDADALSEYRDDPETLFEQLHDGCILTPHEGEFRRLFADILAKLKEPAAKGPAFSKVDAVRAAAARAGCIVLFKGADTVIAAPDGRCAINSAQYDRTVPWLATAGSGDVLAGFITGLLARGLDPFTAARTAAWLHVECARKFGPGLIAEDLPEQLPGVFRDLGH